MFVPVSARTPIEDGGATVVAAYSPRLRPGVPVSFPIPWGELDRVTPADFTLHAARRAGAARRNSGRVRTPGTQRPQVTIGC